MEFKFTNTYSSAPESGGDDITRNRFLKEYGYKLMEYNPEAPLGIQSYPPEIYNTPEKAALAMHCMCTVMRKHPVCMNGHVLEHLAKDIENYSFDNPLRKEFVENIVTAMASVIEAAMEEPILIDAMTVMNYMQSMKDLGGFVLPINKKKYFAASNEYQNSLKIVE